MSKYIRTETHIFGIGSRKVKIKDNYFQIWKTINGQRKCEEYKFIKESDNLEELCDRFVTVFDTTNSIYKELEPKQNMFLDDAIKALEKWDKRYNPQIYGAIWTNKGLIFVAKMNKDGELELI